MLTFFIDKVDDFFSLPDRFKKGLFKGMTKIVNQDNESQHPPLSSSSRGWASG